MTILKNHYKLILFAGAIVFVAIVASFAYTQIAYASNTYTYVDTNGNLATVVADNANEALSISVNRAPESGVMLTSTNTTQAVLGVSTTSGMNSYMYVDINGNVRTIEANSSQNALNRATNRAPESGVALI